MDGMGGEDNSIGPRGLSLCFHVCPVTSDSVQTVEHDFEILQRTTVGHYLELHTSAPVQAHSGAREQKRAIT